MGPFHPVPEFSTKEDRSKPQRIHFDPMLSAGVGHGGTIHTPFSHGFTWAHIHSNHSTMKRFYGLAFHLSFPQTGSVRSSQCFLNVAAFPAAPIVSLLVGSVCFQWQDARAPCSSERTSFEQLGFIMIQMDSRVFTSMAQRSSTSSTAQRQNVIFTSKNIMGISFFGFKDLQMRFSSKRSALFAHLNFQEWSEPVSSLRFRPANVLRAKVCNLCSALSPETAAPAALPSLLLPTIRAQNHPTKT